MSEKLMLKPGPNGWDKYCELVAEAYARAPKFDESAVSSFEAMKPFVDKMFKRIEGVVDVQFVEEHPYADAGELKQDVKQNGVLRISTLDAVSVCLAIHLLCLSGWVCFVSFLAAFFEFVFV